MLDMSKLPSHKVENGIVVFDEPYRVDLQDFMHSIMECDSIILREISSSDNKGIYAFASLPEYNSNLVKFFKSLETGKYSHVHHSSSQPDIGLVMPFI